MIIPSGKILGPTKPWALGISFLLRMPIIPLGPFTLNKFNSKIRNAHIEKPHLHLDLMWIPHEETRNPEHDESVDV